MQNTEVLLEHILHTSMPWAIRFYQDGRVEEYRDQMMRVENNQVVTQPQPPEWRLLTRLSDEEMAALVDVIRYSKILTLPKKLGEPQQETDAAVAEWYAHLGDRENRLSAWEPDASQHPGLKELSVAIQTITASALQRDSD